VLAGYRQRKVFFEVNRRLQLHKSVVILHFAAGGTGFIFRHESIGFNFVELLSHSINTQVKLEEIILMLIALIIDVMGDCENKIGGDEGCTPLRQLLYLVQEGQRTY
jgi:hypothetical protein